MKKFATIALTLAMAATAACASATTVGICQLVQHEALDAATIYRNTNTQLAMAKDKLTL